MHLSDPTSPPPTLARLLLRNAALALLCGLLQALLPRYPLGSALLVPLSVVLGVTVAAVMTRGLWMLPAALLGTLAGDLIAGSGLAASAVAAGVLGLQAATVGGLLRRHPDPKLLQFDTWQRLRSFVLVAAPNCFSARTNRRSSPSKSVFSLSSGSTSCARFWSKSQSA